MGGGNNTGMRAAGGRYWLPAQLRRLGSGETRSSALVAFGEPHPRAAVVGPRLSQSGRVAAALRARRPDALAPRDRVPVPAQARPAHRPLQRVLRRRVRPRHRRARSSRCTAPRCSSGARPPTRSGSSTRRSSCSARRRTGSTASGGGLEGALHPRRRGRPCRRRLARRPALRREPARHPALPRQASGRAPGRAGARLLLSVAAPARARLPRRARARLSRGRALSRLGDVHRSCA